MSNDDDSQSLVYDVEYRLLKRVLDTSSDLVKARNWPEFRDACGGIEKLEVATGAVRHPREVVGADVIQ